MEQQGLDHQDLKPVILKKSPPPSKFQRAPNAKKLDNILSDEPTPLKTVGSDIGKKLQQARAIKKLTRVQLAKSLNLQESVIASHEQGTAIYNGALLAKIKKFLDVKA